MSRPFHFGLRPFVVCSALASAMSFHAHAQGQPAAEPSSSPGAATVPIQAPTSASAIADSLQQELAGHAREILQLRQALHEQELRQLEMQRALEQRAAEQAATPTRPPNDAQRLVKMGRAPTPQPEPQPANVAPLFEQPGILTPKGQGVLEPSIQYAYSSSNRVALVGYTIIPALLVGLVDIREIKRNTLTAALTGRVGVTNRLEVEGKVPYVYRADSTISREVGAGASSDRAFSNKGQALGDIEWAIRYQLNQGGPTFPFLIGSLRYKSRTGKDPFDVVTDCTTRCVDSTSGTGLPQDLPTGSGFESVQPGLTWLFPTDPAVFFGGASYTYSIGRRNVSRLVLSGERESLGNIKPGGVIGVNFGMGLALNDRASFSVGVDLNSVAVTKQNGQPVAGSVRTQLASLLLGYAFLYSEKTSFNVTVGAGLTRDTPDLTIGIRVPKSF